MKTLVIQPELDDPPHLFGEWLAAAGAALEVCHPYAGDAVPTVLDGGPGLADPQRLAAASAEGRFGSTALGADLALEVPVDTASGTYKGVLTVSVPKMQPVKPTKIEVKAD